MEYNMSWFATAGTTAAPYLLATDLNDVMLNNVLDAPMLSDTPRSVSLMGGGGGAGEQTAGHDMAATVPQEFAEWGYQEYTGYDGELKPDDMELETEEDMTAGGDAKRKTTQNAKKPKVHLDPKLKLKGPITYEKDVDPSLIPINRDGMARCEKCGAIGVRHAFYTRERRYCSLRCARSVEGLAAENDSEPATPEAAPPESPASAESTASTDGGDSTAVAPAPRQAPHSFSWDSLMRSAEFRSAPVPSFPHAPLAGCWENVCVGLKVEVAGDVQPGGAEPACWVGTVLRVEGYRGLVRYEGVAPEEGGARWMDLCSDQVHPVGWCATQGRPLIPPAVLGNRHADWGQLLVKRLTGARTLPANFHHKVLRSLNCSLREDQVVEVVDKNCISQVRAAAVTRVVGRRLQIRYLDAPEDDGGFWCHERSPLVHPVGWALSVGHRLSAPPEYVERCQSGQFLPCDATEPWQPPAPPVPQDGFAVGMKLEALDPLNLSSIGVATVQSVLGSGYLMVRLESLPPDPAQPGRDWFCYHASSSYIFPARFCETVGVPLTPPHGYAEGFSWEAYLAAEGAVAAPAALFQRPPLAHGFQPGQRLEAVDLMDPQLVCVATVAAVVGRLLRVHFTGWEEQFDQWVDAASPDIFPVGWCRMVGYKLEPPRAGERGKRAGRRRLGRKVVNRRQRPPRLPAEETALPGLLPDAASVAAEMATADPVSAVAASVAPAGEAATQNLGVSDLQPPPLAVPEPSAPTPAPAPSLAAGAGAGADPPPEKLIPRLLDSSSGSPGAASPCGELDPESWSVADVGQFLRVNECAAYCENFERAGVDGPHLLELKKDQVLELACWKVGPSLKIENLVQKLRARVAPAQARFMASFKKV